MRRITAMLALVCGGLMACGGGDGDSLAGGEPNGSGKDGPGAEEAAEVTTANGVDPSVCPPVDELAQRTGESLALTEGALNDDRLDCTYLSEDSDLRVMAHCQDFESVEAATDDVELRLDYVPGTAPYDGVAGEGGVIQNMELSDPGLATLGYRAIVRQGVQVCQSLWATDEPRDADQQAGLRGLLDYLSLTLVG
jgi:hypothetical protein